MRTTLDIDPDILGIAKQMAAEQNTSTGRVISNLVRKAMQPKKPAKVRNGVVLFEPKPGAKRPTLELINKLRDEM